MNHGAKVPRTLRAGHINLDVSDIGAAGKVSMAALAAAGAFGLGAAHAQSTLPPVNIDAPSTRPKPPAKQTAEQKRVRAAVRRAAKRQQQAAPATPTPGVSAEGATAPDANPYANPNSPYKVDRLASPKFTEPVLNTPRTITVLTKELLADKNATMLKEVARTTAGVTLGTGEGGNAFGDRFFIRGFDARNDIFVDGVRDPAVSIRENFFTEQVEILRGPGSSFAGRGVTGGAINIVTKQARDRDFYNMDASWATDNTKRVTVDVNKVINPLFSVRLGGMFQDGEVAGRKYITDDRWGGFIAVKAQPTDWATISANYIHVDLNGLPDFGVPYYRPSTSTTAGGPFTEFGVPRNNFYGFVNRDFQKVKQDIGTLNLEFAVTDDILLSNKTRAQRSVLNYLGTLPEAPVITNPNPLLWTVSANPQSRYQVTDVYANQTDATFKHYFGDFKNTAVVGLEFSRENVSRNSYTGLTSEALPGGFSGTGSLLGVNIFDPQNNLITGFPSPVLTNNPTITKVDTAAGYIIDTLNYRDVVILNGGLRVDDYNVSASNNLGSNSIHSTMVNWNAGLVFKPVKTVSIYGAYATSSNPVGAELDGLTAQYGGLPPFVAGNPTQVFDPEKNRAIEFGYKQEMVNGRFLFTAAVFQTNKENARELATINGVAGTVVAGAAYYVRGVDFGAAGKITDQLSLYAGMVLMESAVTKSNVNAGNVILFPTVGSVSGNVGLPLSNIAHQSFNFLAKYKLTPEWEIGGQGTYVSKIYGGTFLAANQGTSIPDHWRWDAFTEYKVTKNVTAKVFVNNIFNELYYDGLYQSGTPFVLVAPGRSATFQLSARF
jgi:catecholate siderophore receptor